MTNMRVDQMTAEEFLTDEVRAGIATLADKIIPAKEGRPSASEVGVHSRYVDVALRGVPKYINSLSLVLPHIAEDSPNALATIDEQTLQEIIELVIVCYFMSPAARRSVDYPGQQVVPILEGETEYYLEEDDILQPVIARGSLWRDLEDD